MNFHLLYSIILTFCIAWIELSQYTPLSKESKIEANNVEIIAIPPKPEGSLKTEQIGDGEGVFYTEDGCKKQPDKYKNICFHQLARQRANHDIVGALEACQNITKIGTLGECQADVAELYAPYDKEKSLEVCPTIQRKKWRDQCTFGIALALSTIDSKWAFRTCDKAGQWRDFCRHDVNGEIAVVNLELALEHCGWEEGDLLRRKTCWHGIGKYIARVDIDRAYDACSRVPKGPNNLYIENCHHGLGWGGSEQTGMGFLPTCERSGEYQDSCLLGVAYNLRRFDISQGLEICDKVRRSDLRNQCIKFVGGG